MNKIASRVSIITASAVIVSSLGVGGWVAYDMNEQIQRQSQENTRLQEEFTSYKNQTAVEDTEQSSKVEELEKKIAEQEKILQSREGFLAEVAAAQPVIESAGGKVDVTEPVNRIKAAQDVVAAERTSFENVDAQTVVVKESKDSIVSAVTAYETEQAKKVQEEEQRKQQASNNTKSNTSGGGGSSNNGSKKNTNTNTSRPPSNNNGGGSGGGSSQPAQPQLEPAAATARQALNDVGGSWVELRVDDVVCNWELAVGCAYYEGYVVVKRSYLGEDYKFWYDVMMHEYAHMVQYKSWWSLMEAPVFKSMFGGDVEWLADCMAAARIPGYYSGYGYSCSGEQLSYGANAWNGVFP